MHACLLDTLRGGARRGLVHIQPSILYKLYATGTLPSKNT